MIRTRGIAAVCVVALAAVALPATTSTAAGQDASTLSAARQARTTIEGELLVAVAHGPGVEQTHVSVRTEDGAIVTLDAASLPEVLETTPSGAEVAVTVAVPADVLAGLRTDGVDDAALAAGTAEAEVAAALAAADEPAVASTATVLSDDADVTQAPDIAAGGAIGALAAKKTHYAHVAVIDDATATGDYTETTARASLNAGVAYWTRETAGAMAGMVIEQVVTHPTRDVCRALADGGVEKVWDEVAKAHFANIDFSRDNARHLVVFAPTGCFKDTDPRQAWTGMARINTDLASGGEVMIKLGDPHTVAHELGHNFGLGHSDLLRDGRTDTYLGLHSVQGIAMFDSNDYTTTFATPALDVAYEWLLETEPTSAIASGTAGGTFTLQPASASSGVRAVGLVDSAKRTYFVEYRDGRGSDAGTFYSEPHAVGWNQIDASPGVRVYELDYSYGWRVLTLTRKSGTTAHSTLKAGQSIKTRDGAISIGVTSISGGRAAVKITGVSKTSVAVAKATHGKKAKVTVKVTGPVRPTGAVTIYDGSKKVATTSLTSAGTATAYLPASTRAGKRSIKAVYAGSSLVSGSSSTRTIKVAKAKAKIKVVKAKNLKRGKKATVTLRLTGTSATKPAGKVTVKVGSKTVSKAVKVKKVKGRWTAVVKTKALPKGKVRVVYTPTKTAGKNLAKITVTTPKRIR